MRIVVDLRLLGSVELVVGGRIVEVGPPQRRAVLAALATDTGRAVPAEVLVDRVWGLTPPAGARRALQAHITRLRRLCEGIAAGDDSPMALLRRSGGYVLQARPEQVDALRFRDLTDRARDPQRTDTARAALLREALGLWRGDPLTGLDGAWADRVRESWRRRYVDAVLAWAGAESRSGDPASGIGRLSDLLGEHPLLEPVAEALMRALYAAGRGAEALDCYAATSKLLADRLGADPGPGLQRVHRDILQGTLERPAPTGPRAVGPPAPPPGTVPAQLPATVRGFTGRERELAALETLFAAASDQPSAVLVAAISGTAGVGKTTLAVQWAHSVQRHFPDGQLYVNLRGHAPTGGTLGPEPAVRGFLDAFGVPPGRIPAGLDAQTGLYRSLLAGRRMLVVLDDARDTEQVRPLLPGAPGCLALVTSRRQLTGLAAAEGAHLLTVGLLAPAQARELLARRLGTDRTAAEPGAVRDIADRCAGLPLALAIAAARAAAEPRLPLAALAAELARDEGRLDALDAGEDTSRVRAVFASSYRALEPEAARLFRLLGLHSGPDAGLPAIAALAGLPQPRTRALLTELVRAHLVTEPVPRRYGCHDLLRAYATELIAALDDFASRRAAGQRLLDHYLGTARAADALVTPRPDAAPPEPGASGAVPQPLAGHEEAHSWLATEHRTLLAALRQAPAAGFDTYVWRLASALTTYLDRHGYWRELATAHELALAAAHRQGDPAGLAEAHRGLGLAHDRLGHREVARVHYGMALALFERLGSHAGLARTHQHLARMSAAHDRPERSLEHARSSLEHYRAAGDRAGQSAALNHIGWLRAQSGHHEEALAHCRRALALAEETDDLNGQAHTWDSLGFIARRLGRLREAVGCYEQAVRLFHDTGELRMEATGLIELGDVHTDLSEDGAARTAWRRAEALVTALAPTGADPLRADVAERLGGPPE